MEADEIAIREESVDWLRFKKLSSAVIPCDKDDKEDPVKLEAYQKFLKESKSISCIAISSQFAFACIAYGPST